MNKPLTFGTPEHTAWAKKGEHDGTTVAKFLRLVDELCELIEESEKDIDMDTWETASNKIGHSFDLDRPHYCE